METGSGYALSCQCFVCAQCSSHFLRGLQSFDRCVFCGTADANVASLRPGDIPPEISELLCNYEDHFERGIKVYCS
jgi:hypothetical protein